MILPEVNIVIVMESITQKTLLLRAPGARGDDFGKEKPFFSEGRYLNHFLPPTFFPGGRFALA
jgi:hypothetical protein